MDFDLTEDQEAIRDAVRTLRRQVRRRLLAGVRHRPRASRGSSTRRSPRPAGSGIAIPEEYGGGGPRDHRGGPAAARRSPPRAPAMNGCSAHAPHVFGINPVVKHGSDELRERDPAARGRRATCTSPSASPSPTPAPTRRGSRRSRRATASATSSTGSKVWISKALESEKVLLLDPHDAARGGANAAPTA